MSFKIEAITEEYKNYLIQTNGWDKSCPLDISRLAIVDVSFLGFDKNLKNGKLITMDVAAPNVLEVFKELLISEFPIYSVNLLDIYEYDDYKSMSANNSSCFNNRLILPAGKEFSIHAYGLAIDINPVQNPMISHKKDDKNFALYEIYPSEGRDYINRILSRPGMVEHVVDIFFKNGFDVWGGLWNEPIDYHHFQVNRHLAEKLASSAKETAQTIWHEHLKKRK